MNKRDYSNIKRKQNTNASNSSAADRIHRIYHRLSLRHSNLIFYFHLVRRSSLFLVIHVCMNHFNHFVAVYQNASKIFESWILAHCLR